MSVRTKAEGQVVRDFTYIKPSGRRLTEYEAVNMYVQIEDGLMGSDGWFVKGHEGRLPWRAESTRLQHPHWFDFRDPAKKWQRTHTRDQAEQERAIERMSADTITSGAVNDIDPSWLQHIVRDHYRVWSFVEYGVFKPFASAQREALSDTLGAVCVFTGLDRLRHAQDIVIWLMDLETSLEGFKDEGGKERWTTDPVYQPARQLIEKLVYGQWDWGELAVATSLVIDPILTEVGVFQLVQRNGAHHGDSVTPFIASTAARDRRWSLGWTESLVKLVTADDVPTAKENRAVLEEWVAEWTPLALEAASALAPIYTRAPRMVVSHDQAMATAQAQQKAILEPLGLGAGVTA